MVTLRKAIVLLGVACVLLTASGVVDLDDDDDPTTPALALTVGCKYVSAKTRVKVPSLILITVAVVTAPISRCRTAEGVFDLLSRTCRSNLQSFCLLRC
jgi:di/tricarboxylate transporter